MLLFFYYYYFHVYEAGHLSVEFLKLFFFRLLLISTISCIPSLPVTFWSASVSEAADSTATFQVYPEANL